MGTISILEPGSVAINDGFVNTGGTLITAVNDSDDATFIRKPSSGSTYDIFYGVNTATVNSTTAIPWRLRGMARLAQGASASTTLRIRRPEGTIGRMLLWETTTRPSKTTTGTVTLSGSGTTTPTPAATVTGDWVYMNAFWSSSAPGGQYVSTDEYRQKIIDDIQIGIRDASTAATRATVYALWLELETTTRPTLTIAAINADTSSPYSVTTSTRPLVEWTYAQGDGLVQSHYEVALYSAPTTDITSRTNRLWTSGQVASAATTATVDYDLVSGTTYYLLFRAGFQLGETIFWSATATSGAVSVSLTAPTVPSLTAGYDTADGHASITVTGAAYTLGRQLFDVQRSTDGGVTWDSVRNAETLLPDSQHRVVVEDYELPRGPAQQRINLCPNPSFEVSTASWAQSSGCTIARSTAWSDDGAASLLITPTGASSDNYAVLGPDSNDLELLQPGRTYTISATCYVPAAQTGTLNSRARSIAVFYAPGTGSFTAVNSAQAANTAGNVERLSLTFTLPADTQVSSIRLMNGATNSASNLIYWDSVLIEEASSAGEYFDGSGGGTNLLNDPSFTEQSLNLLTVDESTIEDSIGGWAQTTNVAATFPSRTTTQAFEGTYSVQWQSAAAGQTSILSSPVPVTQYRWYTASARFRANTTTRTTDIIIRWFSDAAGTTLLSENSVANASATATGWALVQGQAQAPLNAVSARLVLRAQATAAAGELFFADAIGIWAGTGGGSWVPGGQDTTAVPTYVATSATANRDTSVARSGSSSARVTRTGTFPSIATERFPVVTGTTYTASAYVMVPALEPGLEAYLEIQWFSAATGGFLSGSSGSNALVGSDTGWVRVTRSATAPASATFAAVVVVGSDATGVSGQTWYVDDVAMRAVSNSQGTYIDPSFCRWTGDEGLSPSLFVPTAQSATPAAVTCYRARAYASVNGLQIASTWSQVRPVLVRPDGAHWLKDPLAPTANLSGVRVLADPSFSVEEQTTVLRPLGRSDAVVVSGALGLEDGRLQIVADITQWAALERLLRTQRVLLWQDPFGHDRYIRIIQRDYTREGAAAAPLVRVDCDFVETAAP